ncbi:RibD family protein [Actinomadura oligospora]|uniref:RibD family protein n=1 Tax=Actinomadura oligospora TaxID=111804 RepID=UPI0004B2E997|nr:dihydrofolate reductase family protein [Actinomadura oligospora]
MTTIPHDLASRGVKRLMVEGGGTVHTQFLTAGLADELQLVIAPFFVGDTTAPRFVGAGTFQHHPGNRMTLAEARPIGDVILARYLMSH